MPTVTLGAPMRPEGGIEVELYVNREARTWIAGGYDPGPADREDVPVQVDLSALSAEDRALLARYVRLWRQGGHQTYRLGDASGRPLLVEAPTLGAILAACRQAEEQEAAEKAERKARYEADIAAILSAPVSAWIEYDRDGAAFLRELPSLDQVLDPYGRYPSDERVQQRREEVRLSAEYQAAAAEAEQRRRAKEEAEAAARAEGEARLRAWALEHGSERARLLIEEGHRAWASVAEREFIKSHVPHEWRLLDQLCAQYGLDECSEKERTKPTAEDIRALRKARQLAADDCEVLSDPRLVFLVGYLPQKDEDGGDEEADEESRSVRLSTVRLTVTAPTRAYDYAYYVVHVIE
jgi:hypothetical protein